MDRLSFLLSLCRSRFQEFTCKNGSKIRVRMTPKIAKDCRSRRSGPISSCCWCGADAGIDWGCWRGADWMPTRLIMWHHCIKLCRPQKRKEKKIICFQYRGRLKIMVILKMTAFRRDKRSWFYSLGQFSRWNFLHVNVQLLQLE